MGIPWVPREGIRQQTTRRNGRTATLIAWCIGPDRVTRPGPERSVDRSRVPSDRWGNTRANNDRPVPEGGHAEMYKGNQTVYQTAG